MKKELALTFTMVTILPTVSTAQQSYVLDLSTGSGATTTLSVPAGDSVSIQIVNIAPAGAYETTLLRERIPIPPLDIKAVPFVLGTGGECNALTMARDLRALASEAKVAQAIVQIEANRADCTDPIQLRMIDAFIGLTRRTFDVGAIQAGELVRVTVTKKTEPPQTWTLVLTAGARGSWRTLYGVAIGSGKQQKFFAKATGTAGQFIVTAERPDADEAGDLAVIPAAFFQWLPMTRELKDWAVGPTLGLGAKTDRPAFFIGGIVTFNQNLGIVAGLPIYQESKLRGAYTEGQTVGENLSEDQLNKRVYRFQGVFLAGVFRFTGNPFAGNEEKKGEEKKDPPKEQPKK